MNSRISLKQRLSLNLNRSYRNTQKKLHPLKCLYWETTLDCNLNCRHCGSDCTKSTKSKNMPLEEFLKVLRSIKRRYNSTDTFIGITGGEPLLREDLDNSIRSIRELGFTVGLVSNGYLLNRSRFESLIKAGLNTLSVSFDGLEDSHNWLRNREDAFKNSLEAISLGGVYSRSNHILFDVITCIYPGNINQLDRMRALLLKLGVKRWRIIPIFGKGRARDNNKLLITDSDYKILFNFIENNKNRDDLIIDYGCEGFLGSYEGRVRNKLFSCDSGISTASILNDGSITGCVSMRGDFIQGNIYNDSFIDVWEKRFLPLRDRGWTKTGICRECSAYKWCEGGGLHLREGLNQDTMNCIYHNLTGR